MGRFFMPVIALLVTAGMVKADIPQRIAHVNDFGKVMKPEHVTALEAELAARKAAGGGDFVVVTVETLGGMDVELYARTLMNEWNIGADGIVILVASKERKARIQLGKDVTCGTTNSIANRIMQKTMVPALKADMSDGITQGTRATLAVDWKQETADAQRISNNVLIGVVCVIGGLLFIAILVIAVVSARERGKVRRSYEKMLASVSKALEEVSQMANHADALESRAGSAGALAQRLEERKQKVTRFGNDWYQLEMDLGPIDRELDALKRAIEGDKAYAERARNEGPVMRAAIPDMIETVRSKLTHPDVKAERAQKLNAIAERWSAFEASELARGTPRAQFGTIEPVHQDLQTLEANIEYDKKFAEKARAEGPALLATVPDLLAKAEQKLSSAKGRKAEEDRRKLQEARNAYKTATSTGGDTSLINNWVMLYVVLLNCQSTTGAIESASYTESSGGGYGGSGGGYGGDGGGGGAISIGGYDGGGATGTF